MRSWRRLGAITAVAAAAACLVACGGGESASPDDAAAETGIDAASDATRDSTAAEDASEAEADAADACDPTSTTARERMSGKDLAIGGVTTDDEVIVQSNAFGSAPPRPLWSVPLDCSAPKTILDDAGPYAFSVRGRVVFSWGKSGGPTPLTAWSASSGGAHLISTTSHGVDAGSRFDFFDATPDGKTIAFLDDVVFHPEEGGTYEAGDVAIANVDGTGRRTVVTGWVGFGVLGCDPWLQFVGGRLVVGYCGDPASLAPATIVSIDPATGASTTIATGMDPYFSSDASGTTIAMHGRDRAESFASPTGGGGATKIADDVGFGWLVGDPATGFAWETFSGTSWMFSPIPTVAPITVFDVTGRIEYPQLSPDAKWLTFSTTGWPGDVWIGPATVPGAAMPIAGASNALRFGFTRDSSRALVLSNWIAGAGAGEGDLVAASPDGTTTTIATSVSRIDPLDLDSSTILYADDETNDGSGSVYPFVYDLHVVDAAKSGPPTLVARAAKPGWTFDAAAKTVVYVTTASGIDAGLYALRLP